MKRMGLVLAVVLGVSVSAWAEDSIRPELGKPLQAAQELIKAKKFSEALDKLHEADGIAGRSSYENQVLEQLRFVASLNGGQAAGAAKAFDALAATGRLAAPDQQRYELAVAGAFYQVKDYAAAAGWAKRYQADGGTDPQVETLVLQSLYQGGDYAGVIKLLSLDAHLSETQLQILGSSYLKLNDGANYAAVLLKLAEAYPKEEYWADLIHRTVTRQGFADRLGLDVGRLELVLGRFKNADQYVEQAELALQAGLPAEAKDVLSQGFAKGLLGSGPEGERHRRLLDAATKGAANDQGNLAKEEAAALAAKDGNALVAVGGSYFASGQAAKAVQVIQQGIERGGLKRVDDARLHLGLALIKAGDKSHAAEALRQVGGADGAADLARLWLAEIGKV